VTAKQSKHLHHVEFKTVAGILSSKDLLRVVHGVGGKIRDWGKERIVGSGVGWMKSAATAENNRKSGIKRGKKGQVRKTKPGVDMGGLGEGVGQLDSSKRVWGIVVSEKTGTHKREETSSCLVGRYKRRILLQNQQLAQS
jgi:hypothetical protein